MSNIRQEIENVIRREGGYVNHPDDRELLYRSAVAEGKEIPENRVVAEWRRNQKAD